MDKDVSFMEPFPKSETPSRQLFFAKHCPSYCNAIVVIAENQNMYFE